MEFPNFAFCDSTAFVERIGIIANETLYNATTFNVEVGAAIWESSGYKTENIKSHSLPTTDNGYCSLFELHGKFEVNTVICELLATLHVYKCAPLYLSLLVCSLFDASK